MTTMTIDDFEERAMAYGADIDSWPAEDRAPARALLLESAAARTALEDARSLDAMLNLWEGPQPSTDLLSRVLADAATVSAEAQAMRREAPRAEPERPGLLGRLFGNAALLRPGLALAACLALGFVMGNTIEQDVLIGPIPTVMSEQGGVIDFAFAMEDDADLLLGSEALL